MLKMKLVLNEQWKVKDFGAKIGSKKQITSENK